MTDNTDEKPDGMQVFGLNGGKYAFFTADGDFIAVLDSADARPLILRPAARRQFLAEHSSQAGELPNGA